MQINTCKNCPDRCVGCHQTCERYIEARNAYLKEQQAIKDARNSDSEIRGYRQSMFRKNEREKRLK